GLQALPLLGGRLALLPQAVQFLAQPFGLAPPVVLRLLARGLQLLPAAGQPVPLPLQRFRPPHRLVAPLAGRGRLLPRPLAFPAQGRPPLLPAPPLGLPLGPGRLQLAL